MGPISVDSPGQDNPGRRGAPGAESNPHCKAAHRRVVGPALNGTTESDYEVRKGQTQTRHLSANAGSRAKGWVTGKALSEMPVFQPYWAKPAVRNDGGP
jgi:hypothetical protein